MNSIKNVEKFLDEIKKDVSPRDYGLIKKAAGILQHNVCRADDVPWGKNAACSRAPNILKVSGIGILHFTVSA